MTLKILSSAGNAAQKYKAHLKMAQRIQNRTQIASIQDNFILSRTDSNSLHKHIVLVLPLRGPSLSTLMEQIKRPVTYHVSATKQLLQAVLGIYDAGLVHRGKSPRQLRRSSRLW